jgi:hypothetical protein
MRIGVIRGDVPGPVCLNDLETISQFNPPTEPKGQETHLARPNPTVVGAFLATLPAAIRSNAPISFAVPLVINPGNQDLKVKLAPAGPFVTAAVANAGYASLAALLVAVNNALVAAAIAANAVADASGTKIVLQTNAVGIGSYIGIDSFAGGSTFNAPANFTDSDAIAVPTTAATITALNPIGNLDVSAATILATLGAALAAPGIADIIAPQFVEIGRAHV